MKIIRKMTQQKREGKYIFKKMQYIKNRNNFYNQEDIQGNVHYDSTHKEGHSHKHEELSEHQHIGKSEKSSVNQHTHKSGEASVYQHTHTHVDANGNVYTHTHTHSPQIVKNELNRIARIIGHMKSIKIMLNLEETAAKC